jgi:zinc protease
MARDQYNVLTQMAIAIFNDRLAELARRTNPPFLEARLTMNNRKFEGFDVSIGAAPGAASILAALNAVESQRREILRDGVRQSEVDEKMAGYRTFFQTELDAANSTPSPRLAAAMMQEVAGNSILTSPARNRTLIDEIGKSANADSVSAAFRALFAGEGPIVLAMAKKPPSAMDQLLIATQLSATPAAGPASDASVPDKVLTWPYSSFGVPGKVSSRAMITDLGITSLRFANGVTAMIDPTKFRSGQILVDVRLGHGRLGLSRSQAAASWLLAGSYLGGGLGKLSIDDAQHVLAGKAANIDLGIDTNSYDLHGVTRPEDLDLQMQLLAAFVTDPAWRPEAMQRMRVAVYSALAGARGTPDGALALGATGILHGGDPRWQTPSPTELQNVRIEDVKALLQNAFAGPISVTIVGDVDPAAAEKAIAATFGALPQRNADTPVAGDEIPPRPSDAPIILYHNGPSDQAVAAIGWPTLSYFPDLSAARAIYLLSQVISTRLFDELRVHDGLTYTPQVSAGASLVSQGYGYLYSFADVPPGRIGDYYTAMAKVVADLKAQPISNAELQRALEPRLEAIAQERQTNEYWLGEIAGADTNPAQLDLSRSLAADTKSITPAQLQKLAQTYLTDDKMFRVVAIPPSYTLPPLPH